MKSFKQAAEGLLQRDVFEYRALNRNNVNRTLAKWNITHPTLNVEEYFVLLELLSQIAPQETKRQISEPFANFRYLIAKTLLESFSMHKARYMEKLFAAFEETRRAEGTKHTIISLNWDSLAESYIRTPFDWLAETHPFDLRKTKNLGARPAGNIEVLKPHGSLAWWICRACQYFLIEEDTGRLIRRYDASTSAFESGKGAECPKCSELTLEPGFIPPTGQKLQASNGTGIWGPTWRRMQTALLGCEELNIVGYSFPPGDMQVRVLLRDSLQLTRRVKRINVITDYKVGQARASFEEHILSQFQGTGLASLLRIRDEGVESWAKLQLRQAS